MALGGVLTGRAIDEEHMKEMAIHNTNSLLGSETAMGMSRLAVAVLLITVVMAEAISNRAPKTT